MRTTIDIPADLLKDAMHVAHARTKTMAIILGLKELINRNKLDQLRSMKGKFDLKTDLKVTRKR